jgi:hypothetical protein
MVQAWFPLWDRDKQLPKLPFPTKDMNFKRLEIYAPLAALLLALVALISSTASLDNASVSLEKSGQKFTDAHKAPNHTYGLLLAGLQSN